MCEQVCRQVHAISCILYTRQMPAVIAREKRLRVSSLEQNDLGTIVQIVSKPN